MHPLPTKGKAHEALSLVFQRDGVPPRMVADNSKEQIEKSFKRKCREADCHLVTTEPYSPWMQAAEGCIKQVKPGSSRKMIRTGSPKPLWDHCLELEGGIRSHAALDIYRLARQVPETRMTGRQGTSATSASLSGSSGLCTMSPHNVIQTVRRR